MAEVAFKEEVINEFIGEKPESLVDILFALRAEIADANKHVDGLSARKRLIESALVDYQFHNPTCKKVGTNTATATFSDETIYNVNDWEQVYEYIFERRAFHLLQRRLNNAPIKEILQQGEELAFVDSFTRKKVGLRKA